MKWKYLIVGVSREKLGEEWLNSLGQDGWELVCIEWTGPGVNVIFKQAFGGENRKGTQCDFLYKA